MFTGYADLRLCSGPVPHYKEIVALSGALAEYIVHEFGTEEFLKKLSDPLWFQCFSCLCGFEWQFSGSTTVTLTALKEAMHGKDLFFYGGKGARMKEKPEEFEKEYELSARVDGKLIQDGYEIYFHMLVHDGENWVVIDQGMDGKKYARRYHWINTENFFEDPNTVAGKKEDVTLNITAKENKDLRRTIMDIISDEHPRRIYEKIVTLSVPPEQKTLFEEERIVLPYHLSIPRRISYEAVKIAKAAEDFEELTRVANKSVIRGLAFVAHIVYSTPISWKDPVRYTFAFGTKAGKPYPVERDKMLQTALFLKEAVEESKAGNFEKRRALKRLSRFIQPLFSV